MLISNLMTRCGSLEPALWLITLSSPNLDFIWVMWWLASASSYYEKCLNQMFPSIIGLLVAFG